MHRPFAIALVLFAFVFFSSLQADQSEVKTLPAYAGVPFKAFTGKVIGSNVRMRVAPDLDSHIVSELLKDDYVVVTAEKGEFYAVEPPTEMKAYIFRGFVIDEVVEGDRVNIRLAPDREAPIIGHYSTGVRIDGTICEQNNKWFTINVPLDTRFYIAKEYIEYAGKPEMKIVHDKRKRAVKQLFDTTQILAQTETLKPFQEIDTDRITHNLQTIINDYADFTTYASQANQMLIQFQEDYLQRKIAYLEAKASSMTNNSLQNRVHESSHKSVEECISPTDRMKIWEPVEEALYLSWSAMHHAKTMDDFYQDQKLKSKTVAGILEAYREPVKSRPGDYILKDRDIPVAYVYSTHINLEDCIGKHVTLLVAPRENNNFAFPAFYVLDTK